nr:hypothetical protein Iba_chr12bCG9940 [Ipomoea batatas]
MPGGFVHGRVVFMVAQGCPGYCHVPKIIILRKSPPHPWPAIRQCFSACILCTSTFAVLGRQIRAEKEAGAGEYAGIVCGQGGVETPRREVTSERGIEKRTRRRRRREAQEEMSNWWWRKCGGREKFSAPPPFGPKSMEAEKSLSMSSWASKMMDM